MIHEFKDLRAYLTAFKFNDGLAVIGITDVAKVLGVGRAAVEQRIARGNLNGVRIDRSLYVTAASIRENLDEHDKKVAEIEKLLTTLASKGQMIAYAEAMGRIGLEHTRSADRNKMGVILGEISTVTYEKHGHLLSVLVVKKGTDYPSEGFYNLLNSLDIDYDEDTFHKEEMERVWKAYGFKK